LVNSAFKIQCHIVKNTLLQTAFSVILPTGKGLRSRIRQRAKAQARSSTARDKCFFYLMFFAFSSICDCVRIASHISFIEN